MSHSDALARGVAELAEQMAGAGVRIAAAGGLADQPDVLGTDATLVAAAIDQVWSDDGVLVLMDLGSAVLSAEFALDLLPEERRAKVLLTPAPLVEGAVAAAVAAAQGASPRRAAAEAVAGLAGKSSQLDATAPDDAGPEPDAPEAAAAAPQSLTVTVNDPLGLHARPAARLVRLAGDYHAAVTVQDLTSGRGPVNARSLTAVGTLGARAGDELLVQAAGPDAGAVLAAIRRLASAGFAEPEATAARAPQPAAGPSTEILGPGGATTAQPASAGRREDAGPPAPAPGTVLTGVPASPGLAVGPARPLAAAASAARGYAGAAPHAAAPPGDPAGAWLTLRQALALTAADVRAARDAVGARAVGDEAAIFDAHLLLLEDDELLEAARRRMFERGAGAAEAWREVVAAAAARWAALDDDYLRTRAADVRAVGDQVLARLTGGPTDDPPGPGIVVATDMTPAQTAALDTAQTQGLAWACGGPTSHSAILARALGVPAVAALGEALATVPAGTRLVLDGDAGTVTVDPSDAVVAAAHARVAERARAQSQAVSRTQEPAVTRDGTIVHVDANIAAPADVAEAVAAGADGVGLLRSEFLFLRAERAPTEQEQELAYRGIAASLEGRPLTLRTLDAGADKPLAFLPQAVEQNPSLGLRGLRLSLRHPELLRTQLRAALRVAADHPLRLLFPMVTTVDELLAARRLLDEAAASLRADGLAAMPLPEVGIMVEVPAAALTAEVLAAHADFFSLGTNDLTQYTLAAERGNAAVAALADPLHPAVLRLIERTARAAGAAGRRTAVCGELAADPLAVALLLGLGVTELSLSPAQVPLVKQAVRATHLGEARELARAALGAASAADVRRLCAEA